MRMEPRPEVQRILMQVETELTALLASGDTGKLTIYIGGNQLQIECNVTRKQEPVRIEAPHIAYIKRIRS